MAEPVLHPPPGPIAADNPVAAGAVVPPAEPAEPVEEIEVIVLVLTGVLRNVLRFLAHVFGVLQV